MSIVYLTYFISPISVYLHFSLGYINILLFTANILEVIMKVKSFFKEFKSFALRGNIIDLAVGIIIGSAFNGIVTALVTNIITPLLGIIIGNINIIKLSFKITPGIMGREPIDLPYGIFLQAVINFLIISFCIFLIIKLMSKLHKKEAAETIVPQTDALLTEIRDILKQNNNSKISIPENLDSIEQSLPKAK